MQEKDDSISQEGEHKLQREYKFWYSQSKENKKNMSKEDFENELKPIKSFKTVEEFWGLFLHMGIPSSFKVGSKLFLFQNSIRPLWEDEMNKNGGRFYIRVKQEKADKIWENLVLGYIGDDFEHNHKINGLQLASRPGNVIVISVWTQFIKNYIKDDFVTWIKECLKIPSKVRVEYQDHPRSGGGRYRRRGGGGGGGWDRGYRRKY